MIDLELISIICQFSEIQPIITKPRGYEHSINALDGVTDSGHHRVDLLGKVVLSVQTETLLFLELLLCVSSLTGCQRGAVLNENTQ